MNKAKLVNRSDDAIKRLRITPGTLKFVKKLHQNINRKAVSSEDHEKIDDDPVKTIKDIDHDFFSIVARKHKISPARSAYLNNIRNILRFNYHRSIIQDLILKIEFDFYNENLEYNKAVQLYQHCNNSFNAFLSERYQKADEISAIASKITELLDQKVEESEEASFNFARLRNDIDKLFEKYQTLCQYKLHLITLPALKGPFDVDDRDIEAIQEQVVTLRKICTEDVSPLTGNFDKSTIESLMVKYTKTIFQTPEQLVGVYNTLEKQCRMSIKYHNSISDILGFVFTNCDVLRRKVDAEVEQQKQAIAVLSEQLDYVEEQESYLKTKFYSILNTTFTETISKDSCKLYACLEFILDKICDMKLFDVSDFKLMMHYLEQEYNKYFSLLYELDYKVVAAALKEFYAKDLLMMKNAYKARRALKEFDTLAKSLYRAVAPPFKKPLNSKQQYTR